VTVTRRNVDPILARELPRDVADHFSIEVAFTQGISSYEFIGMSKLPFPTAR